ncbi:MAG TPA: NAD-dependent deacylase [Anaerolineales bacterium]
MIFSSEIIHFLRTSNRLTALTGAGVSQESGLHTFRDKREGLWAQNKPEDLATPEAFDRNPEMVWEFYSMRRLMAGEVQPNPGHLALAEIEHRVPYFSLITQNVDGLHQRAGSKNIIELHGNITRTRCSDGCGVFSQWEDVPSGVPKCPKCGAKLRPDVVWFGEMLPTSELQAAIQAARICDVFFSIGTSGIVQPAATLPFLAKQGGAVLVEINAEETPLTQSADYYFQGKSGEILPELVKQVWEE